MKNSTDWSAGDSKTATAGGLAVTTGGGPPAGSVVALWLRNAPSGEEKVLHRLAGEIVKEPPTEP